MAMTTAYLDGCSILGAMSSSLDEQELYRRRRALAETAVVGANVGTVIGAVIGGLAGAALWPAHRVWGGLLLALLVGAPIGAGVGMVAAVKLKGASQ